VLSGDRKQQAETRVTLRRSQKERGQDRRVQDGKENEVMYSLMRLGTSRNCTRRLDGSPGIGQDAHIRRTNGRG